MNDVIKDSELKQLGISAEAVPCHVAIIMDGNGRWAKARGLSRTEGHRAGMDRIHKIVETSQEIGVKYLTLYAFSTENWKRPRPEIRVLFSLLIEYFDREIEELHANGVCVKVLGSRENIPGNVLKALDRAQDLTKNNANLTLNIAFNYGGRQELVGAARQIAQEIESGRLRSDDVDEDIFCEKLYTHGQPDVDLVIRTSGELRISNFLLYQIAYAEFYITPTYWPDFTKEEYFEAIRQYSSRSRRFGGL